MKRLHKFTALALCAILLAAALCPAVYAEGSTLAELPRRLPQYVDDPIVYPDFVDMPPEEHWSYDAILWAYNWGITAGIDETHFGPREPVTRAQVIMMIWRMKFSPELLNPYTDPDTIKPVPFLDADPNAYYYPALQYAWNWRWIGGVSPDCFGPELVCTRAQLVAILGKAFHLAPPPMSAADEQDPGLIKDAGDFVDVDRHSYYYAALWNFCATGVIAGTDETHFSPNQPCTRAEFVTFLYRLICSDWLFT